MSSRVARLRALIEHPATGAGERAAAQRMLDRIAGAAVRADAADRAYGSRYARAGRHAGLTEIAELVRADIAFARVVFTEPVAADAVAVFDPIRDAPAEIGYRVTGLPEQNSIVVELDSVPPHWGWTAEGAPSAALTGLARALAEIMNSYNHEGAVIGTRFFARVRAGERTLIW
ncbi:hypothetical protein ABZ319_38415 [Nocardia sp. NPDC005978]|uniref:hypothetical protein n=1 Tax=Nocardia sp. NPDC005978 TaxID=3156725 RepID=UPI0033A22A87